MSNPVKVLFGAVGFISEEEVAALKTGVDEAAKVIASACAAAGVTFVDMRGPFAGKGCKGDPEMINCVVLGVGDDQQDQGFHPKEAGNIQYAETLRGVMDL